MRYAGDIDQFFDIKMIIGGLCMCAMLGVLSLMQSADLEDRLKNVETRLEQCGKHDAATRESVMKLLGSSLQ